MIDLLNYTPNDLFASCEDGKRVVQETQRWRTLIKQKNDTQTTLRLPPAR